MSSFKLRVLVLLIAAPLVAALFVATRDGSLLPAGETEEGANPLVRPALIVLDAPERLLIEESAVVRIRAEAPARAGDTVILRTAGTYNLGYNKVSRAVLDRDLRATLTLPGRKYLGRFNYWVAMPATGRYQESRSASFEVAIVAPDAPPAPSCGGAAPVKADGTSWVCTYHDEFDGSELDRRYWWPQDTARSGFTTGTKYRYACAFDSPETIAVRGGNLELSLVDLPRGRDCGKRKFSKYAFGQVMHFQTYAQTYGKYEVRALVPDLTDPGSQQSFWLWPKRNSYGPWPASGEIDFAELYSSAPGIDKPYIHYLPGETEGGTNKNKTNEHCPIRRGDWNTYGVEWEPGRITVLLNDEVCFVNDYRSVARTAHGRYSPFDKPFYLALNQAMGTIGNEYDPVVMPERITTKVDYVRIWQ